MKRVFGILRRTVFAVFALTLALSVVGCGDNSEKEIRKIRDTIDGTFAVLTDPKSAGIAKLYDPNGAELLRNYGVDADTFLHTVFAQLEYTIDDVQLDEDGEHATAQLTISNVNFDIALQSAVNRFDAWSATDEALETYQDGQEAALFQKLFEFLYDEYESYTAVKASTTVRLPLVKEDDDWDFDLTDDASDTFLRACLGGGSLSSL